MISASTEDTAAQWMTIEMNTDQIATETARKLARRLGLTHLTDSQFVHIEHFFPKGYDPQSEPYRTIIRNYNSWRKAAATPATASEQAEPIQIGGRAFCPKCREHYDMADIHECKPDSASVEDDYERGYANGWEACDREAKIAATPSGGGQEKWRVWTGVEYGYDIYSADNHWICSDLRKEKLDRIADAHNASLPAVAGDCGEVRSIVETIIRRTAQTNCPVEQNVVTAMQEFDAAMSETRRGEKSQT